MDHTSTRTNALFLSVMRRKTTSTYFNLQRVTLFSALLLVLAFIAGPGKIQAQANVANYGFAVSNTASFTDMSSGTTVLVAADQDDVASAITNIGFDFYLNGGRQTQFSVNSNGTLRFGATAVSTTLYDPLGQAGQALVTSYGADQRTHAGGGKVHYKVTGTVPNRVLTVEWLNMQANYNAGGTADLTYQLRIYESTGIIESVYGPMNMSTAGAADPNSSSPQFGLSTSNAVGTVGSVTASQSGAPAPTYSGASATPVNNTYVAGMIPVLNSSVNGSRIMFTYTPIVPLAPTALNFTGVSATGMTLNWTDNATNEVGYVIHNSPDGINYSFYSQMAANSTSLTVNGLAASTLYPWRVYAVTEGALSNALAGAQTTSTTGVITSTASGLWSDPNTWSTGVVPTSNDVVTILNGHTVTIDIAAFAYNLTVNGTLQYEQTTARVLTVGTDVTINVTGIFQSNPAGTQTGHSLVIGGNLVNNGILDFSTNADTAGSGITFTGAGNATFSGTGATTDIRQITMNKGTSNASVLEITVTNFTVRGVTTDTVVGGWLVMTNGTIKISGTFAYTGRTFATAAYTIPASCGVWINNPNYTVSAQNGSPTTSGLLRITQGTFNIGTATGNSMGFGTNSTIIVEGGTVNAAARFGVSAAGNAFNYTQSGGTITVCMIGNTSGTLGAFDLGTSALSSINMNGGTVICQLASTAIDYRNQAGSGITGVTGGILQLGNALSGAAKNFNVRGILPNVVVNNTSAGHTATTFSTPTTYNNASLDITITPGATFNTGNNIFLFTGTTLTNNGTLTANGASSNLYMFSSSGAMVSKAITGTGVFTAPITNLSLQSSNVTLTTTNQIPVIRCNVLSGGFTNANKLTMGNAAATTAVIQFGVAGPTQVVTGFDAAPTWSVGTGGVNMFYAPELTGRTTGFEIPPSRMLNILSITNPNDITIAGGDITIGGTGTTPTFSMMAAGNVITGTNTIILGTSTSQLSTFTYPASGGGIIIGNFKRWVDATVTSRDFPVGIAGAKRTVTINYTTAPTTGGSLSTHWVTAPDGINGLPLAEGTLTVNGTSDAGYWSVTPGDGLTGGSYAGTFTATGIPGVTDVTQLVLLERTNSTAPWMLDGTHVTGSGTTTAPILSRTGMTGFTEFGIGSQEFCNASVASLSSDADNTICSGTSVTFTAMPTNGGTPTYQWKINGGNVSGETNSTFTSTTIANNDIVTVVMTAVGNSCFSSPATSAGITMTVNANPVVSGSSSTPLLCNGDLTGSAGISATGTGTLAYNWLPGGATTATITGLAAGTYTCLITDANTCSTNKTVSVTQPAVLTASLSSSAILCNGGVSTIAITATGGTTPYTGTGTYTMMAGSNSYTITDDNSCMTTASVSVSEPAAIFSSQSLTLCAGQSAMVGTSTYSAAGTFTDVIASLINGCDSTITTAIMVNSLPTITVNSGTICSGSSFTMAPNGGLTYTYTGGSNVVSPTSDASYTVTGADNNNCENTAVSSVTVSALPTIMATTNNSLLCVGETATLSVTGGATTYTWSTTETTTDIEVSPTVQTTYTVEGTDGNGCSNTTNITQDVNVCTGVNSIAAANNALTIYPNPFNGIVNIHVTSTYKITVLDVLGKIVYSEQLEEGTHAINLSRYASGLYIVKAENNDHTKTIRLVKE